MAKKREHLNKLKKRLRKALKIKGVGAKTAVGYGYFRNFGEYLHIGHHTAFGFGQYRLTFPHP